MKSIISTFCLLLLVTGIAAKETGKPVKSPSAGKYRALGAGYVSPFFALSGIYGISEHSAVQVLISPISTGSFGLTSYTTRYIYKAADLKTDFKKNGRSIGCPYAFTGVGLLRWSYDYYNDYYSPSEKNTNSTLSYSFGAGYELLLNRKYSISAEVIYAGVSYSGVESLHGAKFGITAHCRLAKSKLFKLLDPNIGGVPQSAPGGGAIGGIGKKAGKKNAATASEAAEDEAEEGEDGSEGKSDTTTARPVLKKH
jgi:hypothetical protein